VILIRVALATAVMVMLLAELQPPAETWSSSAWHLRVGYVAGLVAAGAGAYFFVLLVSGFRFVELRR
jgi:peptidoglycan biosynthesis protein MviN/MurJ (putative lipid II flippase)